MADQFIDVVVESDAQTLADRAVDRLRVVWGPSYEPEEADQEVIQIETLAPMAQNAAETVARVPASIFRKFGTKLAGVPYEQGSAATTTVTFHLADTTGLTIPAGTAVDIDGYVFVTQEPQVALLGATELAGVSVVADSVGSAQNDLTGLTATMITAITRIQSVTVDQPTEGGSDREDDEVYQNRLSGNRRLASRSLVTARDYELEGLAEPGVARIMVYADPQARSVVAVVTDDDGEPVPQGVQDRLVDRYGELRLTNWEVTVASPTYTTVNVTYYIRAYPGYDAGDLIARVDAQLALWLSPAAYGRPKNFGDPGSAVGFANDPVVRVNKLIDLIGDVDGVDYVSSITLSGSQGTVESGNLVMPGAVPLPRPGTLTGGLV